MLALGVAVLVAVDVIILAVYNMVEGVRGNLGATRVFDRENPEDRTGVCNYNWLSASVGIVRAMPGVKGHHIAVSAIIELGAPNQHLVHGFSFNHSHGDKYH